MRINLNDASNELNDVLNVWKNEILRDMAGGTTAYIAVIAGLKENKIAPTRG